MEIRTIIMYLGRSCCLLLPEPSLKQSWYQLDLTVALGMRWGDSIKIGRAAGRLVIVDQLADGLTIHAATGAAVLVVFGLFNLAAITPERIRKRWPSQCLTYAPANGFNPPSAVGFSEPAAMARALGAGLAVLDSRDTWVSISNKSGLEGVRTAFDRNRLPLRSGVRS